MKVTNVTIAMVRPENRDSRQSLRAFAKIDLESEGVHIVIRDVKIIQTERSGLFVLMPSRPVTFHCGTCRHSNDWNARYCNHCGAVLPEQELYVNAKQVPIKSYDVVYPVNPHSRKVIVDAVLQAYQQTIEADVKARTGCVV